MPIIESVMGIQVIGNSGENIIKSPIVEAYIGSSLLDSTEVASDTPTDISTKVEQLMAAKHSHSNKAVLDKFAESDGKPTYDGQALGGGTSDFIIKMTVEGDGDYNYIVTSCSATVEQIDAAVSAEKRAVVIASVDGSIFELPMLQGIEGNLYYFGAFSGSQIIISFVEKIGNTSNWEFDMNQIQSEDVGYSNAALPSGTTNVKMALDALVTKSHTHANKDTLDKLSDSNGKLQYNGSDVGLKGDKGDKGDPGSDANVTKANVITALGYTPEAVSTQVTTGTNITVADNTEYRLTDVTTLSLSYPTGKFECWMRLTFAASGNITVTLPADTEYLGATPNFKNGETWELSFKDKVLAAKKVGADDGGAGGDNGITPHIGDNGNWYIGNTDTGKPSRGEKGDTGATGADGKTPVKGTDYWTVADKQEIVNDVIAALPDGTEVSY